MQENIKFKDDNQAENYIINLLDKLNQKDEFNIFFASDK